MAIALAEADKYEILEKIGRLLHLQLIPPAWEADGFVPLRVWFIRHNSQSEEENRWLRELPSTCSWISALTIRPMIRYYVAKRSTTSKCPRRSGNN